MSDDEPQGEDPEATGSDSAKQIKVKLPIELILRLQEIRITEGRSVADLVKVALNEYLDRNYPMKPRK